MGVYGSNVKKRSAIMKGQVGGLRKISNRRGEMLKTMVIEKLVCVESLMPIVESGKISFV